MSRLRLTLSLITTLLLLTLVGCSGRRQGDAPRGGSGKGAALRLPSIFARPAFAHAASGPKEVSLSDIAERAVKSVVNISSTRVVTREPGLSPFHGHPFFDRMLPQQPREQRARSLGSGVIVSAEGVVLTNNHVVKDASEIRVRLSDGRELPARILGTDPKSDLAVIKLQGQAGKLQPLPFATSSKLRLGEVVLAIGDPFGVGQTVTMGIVSAVGRGNMGIVDYEDFIQTDAAINPGNSGGALVNMQAELVGINTAILSRSGGYQGIGFAIPSDMARPIMQSLLKDGRVVRGWMGVAIQDLTEEVARALSLGVTRGVLVTGVNPESPAEKAGLRREDVITQIDGKPVESSARLRTLVASAGAAATVKLAVTRGGKPLEVTVKLTASPEEAVARFERGQGALGGITLEPLGDEVRRRLGLPQRASGAVVKSIDPGSPGHGAGLAEGDVILEINRQPVLNPAQFAALYAKASRRVLLLVYRQGGMMYILLDK